MDKEVEYLEDGCSKVEDFAEADEQLWICGSYPFRHKTTLYCADRKANLFSY